MAPRIPPAQNLEVTRRQQQQKFADTGLEVQVGQAADCPFPPVELAALHAGHPAVVETHDSGLTAVVHRVRAHGIDWAVKQARTACKVQGIDGQTSFLNEVQRRAEMATLPALQRPGLVPTLYASVRQGLIVSPWIAGSYVSDWDETGLQQLFDTGRGLIRAGFFEWDFSPGNVIRDARQVWLFDYGYLYRFDPRRHFNSSGTGTSVPQCHLAERIETRHVFGWLLRVEQAQGLRAALRAFEMEKRIALDTYERLHRELQGDGAQAVVLDWLQGLMADWRQALATGVQDLYLREAWRSHAADLEDDLQGQTCTPATLMRARWLLQSLAEQHDALSAQDVWQGDEAALDKAGLLARYEQRLNLAHTYQLA